MNPLETHGSFSPPQVIRFTDKDGSFSLAPRVYAIAESEELDPVTFQPIVGPDYDNPVYLGFFVKGAEYKLLGLIPMSRHFFGSTDGQPVHFLGTDKFGRDVLSRAIYAAYLACHCLERRRHRYRHRHQRRSDIRLFRRAAGCLGAAFRGGGARLPAIAALPRADFSYSLTAPPLCFLFLWSASPCRRSAGHRCRARCAARRWHWRDRLCPAAIAVGATDRRIIFQHILPNVMSHVIVAVTLPYSKRRACSNPSLGFSALR